MAPMNDDRSAPDLEAIPAATPQMIAALRRKHVRQDRHVLVEVLRGMRNAEIERELGLADGAPS